MPAELLGVEASARSGYYLSTRTKLAHHRVRYHRL